MDVSGRGNFVWISGDPAVAQELVREAFLIGVRQTLRSTDFDEFNARRGMRNGKTVLAEAFNVEFYGFLDEFKDFIASFPTATHPGRSGTCAPKLVSPFSMTTAYLIA